jgi:hypothetical protein
MQVLIYYYHLSEKASKYQPTTYFPWQLSATVHDQLMQVPLKYSTNHIRGRFSICREHASICPKICIMPLSVSAPFRLCSFPDLQITDYAKFLLASCHSASFRFCPFVFCLFPFMPLSGLANTQLCQIPFCLFPFMPFSFMPISGFEQI